MANQDVSQPEPSRVNKGITLLMALLVANAGAFMTSSLNIALPAINQEFKPTAVVLNWVITAFILSWGVFSLPTGRLADIFGLRRLTVIGAVIFLVGITAAAFSNSITMLILLRAFQGIGASILAATLVAILTITFPAKERGWALGIYSSAVYFWLSAGPFVGGILTEYLNWRSLFIFNIPFALAILLLALWKVKTERAEAHGEKFDYTGSFIFSLALVGIIYGFSEIRTLFGLLLTAAGIAAAVFFIYWESRARSPLLNIRELRNNRPFLFANLASVITYSATSGTAYLLSLYLQLIKGFSPIQAGWTLIIQPVTQIIFALFSGWLSDRIKPRLVATAGMCFLFVGLTNLIFLSENTSVIHLAFILTTIGIGFGLFVPANTNAVMSSVIPRYYGVASALTSTMRTIGQTLSMGITLVLTAIFIGNTMLTRESHAGFLTVVKMAFVIFAILSLSGIFASLTRSKGHPPKDSQENGH